MPGSSTRPSHRRPVRRLRHGGLLALAALLALASSPLAAAVLPPGMVAQAADCPLPPDLCPPATAAPTPAPTAAVTLRPSSSAAPGPSASAASSPSPATASPRPPATPRPAAAPPASAPPAPRAGPTPSPTVAGPATGLVPQARDATPVRTLGTLTPTSAAVQAWQVVIGALATMALAALVVIRVVRQRRRAAIHARFNRMRVERGMPALTPKQIDFLGPRRRY